MAIPVLRHVRGPCACLMELSADRGGRCLPMYRVLGFNIDTATARLRRTTGWH